MKYYLCAEQKGLTASRVIHLLSLKCMV